MTPPPTTKTTTVTVGGHAYRVTSSATAEELARFAALVDERLLTLPLSQRGDPKSLILVALGLAHDLEHERLLRADDRQQVESRVRALLTRVEGALGRVDVDGESLDAVGPLNRGNADPVASPPSQETVGTEAVVVRPPGAPNARTRESGTT